MVTYVNPPAPQAPQTPAATSAPAVILADKYNPVTRDFASLFKSGDVIDEQVAIAFEISRATGAAVMATGNRFGEVKKIGDDFEKRIENEARLALAQLMLNGDVSITSIVVTADAGHQSGSVKISYENLRAIGNKARDFSTKVGG